MRSRTNHNVLRKAALILWAVAAVSILIVNSGEAITHVQVTLHKLTLVKTYRTAKWQGSPRVFCLETVDKSVPAWTKWTIDLNAQTACGQSRIQSDTYNLLDVVLTPTSISFRFNHWALPHREYELVGYDPIRNVTAFKDVTQGTSFDETFSCVDNRKLNILLEYPGKW